MAEQHPNVHRYMRGIQAFNKNDIDTVKEIFSEDIVYRVAGGSLIAGEYCGLEQFGKLLQRVKELSVGTIALDPQIILADDNAIMVYARATAQRGEKTLDLDHVYLYHFDSDGKIVEGRTIPVDLYAFDEF